MQKVPFPDSTAPLGLASWKKNKYFGFAKFLQFNEPKDTIVYSLKILRINLYLEMAFKTRQFGTENLVDAFVKSFCLNRNTFL